MICGVCRDYTVKMYLQLVEALREKADWLNKQGKQGEMHSPGHMWDRFSSWAVIETHVSLIICDA